MTVALSQYGILLWILTTATTSTIALALFNNATPPLMRFFSLVHKERFLNETGPPLNKANYHGKFPQVNLWGGGPKTVRAFLGFVVIITAVLMFSYPAVSPSGGVPVILYAALIAVLISACLITLWVDGVYLRIPHKVSYLLFITLLTFAAFLLRYGNVPPQTLLQAPDISVLGSGIIFTTIAEFFALAFFLFLITFIFRGSLLGSGDVLFFLSLVPLSLIFGPFTGVSIFFTATVIQSFLVMFLLPRKFFLKKKNNTHHIVSEQSGEQSKVPFVFSIIISLLLFTYPI